mmetsp:Transcript_15717/g.34156  ORF Transcript_15717/g.34156 Transcript_15717/m.34156 type:complete len:293 (+) Transcript_15717:786-1664(+)
MAVVAAPAVVATRPDVVFPSRATHVVKPDLARVVPEAIAATKVLDLMSATIAELTARNRRVAVVEVVVANGSPAPGVVHLQTAAATTAVGEARAIARTDAVVTAANAAAPGSATADANIFVVVAVVASPATVTTCRDVCFVPTANDVVQPDATRNATANLSAVTATEVLNLGSGGVAKLSASNLRTVVTETIVADCAPAMAVANFKTAAAAVALSQAEAAESTTHTVAGAGVARSATDDSVVANRSVMSDGPGVMDVASNNIVTDRSSVAAEARGTATAGTASGTPTPGPTC